jgi:hypothetical protein
VRITESHIRRIIADEARKLKKPKRMNESTGEIAHQALMDGLQQFLESELDSGLMPDEVADSVRNEVENFLAEFLEGAEQDY